MIEEELEHRGRWRTAQSKWLVANGPFIKAAQQRSKAIIRGHIIIQISSYRCRNGVRGRPPGSVRSLSASQINADPGTKPSHPLSNTGDDEVFIGWKVRERTSKRNLQVET